MEDPGETRDLADRLPGRFEEMLADYAAYESRVGVVPVPEDYHALRTLQANVVGRLAAEYGSGIGLMLFVVIGIGLLIRRLNVRRM